MERNEQQPQSQQQPTAVVIVQQPLVVGGGTFDRGQPFLRRGVKLNNGTNIGASCISCLGVMGCVLTFMGLIFTAVGISVFTGILMLLVGGGMLAACFKFCHKAKQDYDALPQDHPDRIIYSAPVFRPHRGGGAFPVSSTAAYQLPPGTQVISSSGGQFLSNFQIPPGTQVIDPSAMGQTAGPYSRGSVHMSQFPGAMPHCMPPQQIRPEEDKPPSYEEVCNDVRNQ